MHQLRVRQRVARPREGLRRNVRVLGEDGLPLVPRPFADPVEQDGAQCSRSYGVGDVRRRTERLLFEQVLEVEGSEERPEQARGVLAELQPDTVAGARHRVEEHRHVRDAQRSIGTGRPSGKVEHTQCPQQAGLDPLATTGVLPLHESGKDALQREHRRAERGYRNRGKRRTLTFEQHPELVGPSRPCGNHALVTGHVTKGMVPPEPRDLAVHEPWVRRAHRRAVDTEPVGGRRLECSDHHVRVSGQLVHAVSPARRRQVDAHAALAPRPHRERGARSQATPVRRLDDQHVGAVIGEHHAGQCGADALADLDDLQARGERRLGAGGARVVLGHAGA